MKGGRMSDDLELKIQQLERVLELETKIKQLNCKDKINAALSKAQNEFPFVKKNAKANYGMYADKFAMMKGVWPILEKYELSIKEHITHLSDGTVHLKVKLVHGPSGQEEETETFFTPYNMNGKDNPDHAWSKSITYRSRTLYRGILGIAIPNDKEDLDDVVYDEEDMCIGMGQQKTILELCYDDAKLINLVCRKFNVANVSQIHVDNYDSVVTWIKNQTIKNTPAQ